MKLWARHWLQIRSRKFGSLREETPLALLSIEKGSIGERDVPIESRPILRHYMSNVFVYLMPKGEEPGKKWVDQPTLSKGESVHGWELKLGMALEEAEGLAKDLIETIEACKKRREERHKEEEREVE